MLAQLALSTLALTFPGPRLATLDLKSVDSGAVRVLYEPDLFEAYSGSVWASALEPSLRSGYQSYASLVASGFLPECREPLGAFPDFTLILVNSLSFDGSDSAHGVFSDVTERNGFYHPDNPGPMVQAAPWDEAGIRLLSLHESFHEWCHADARTPEALWLEEGAADYLAYAVQGRLPQLNVTRYFRGGAVDSPYGGSVIWWLASFESKRLGRPFLETLAELHLGIRGDLVYGSLFDRPESGALPATSFPYGEISSEPVSGPQAASLPFWRAPWGVVSLRPSVANQKPTGYFTWRGPVRQ